MLRSFGGAVALTGYLACLPCAARAQEWQTIAAAPGVLRRELKAANRMLTNRRIWLYKPANLPAGRKLRTVLIAAAGSRMFNGVPLASGDVPEHLPYVRAGFAVIAYETDGTLSGENEAAIIAAARGFAAARGGLENAKATLDTVLPLAPFVDTKHIYAVGHSSAATVALGVAANDPRIAGCVAYAPQPDIRDHLGDAGVALDRRVPGFLSVMASVSPQENAARLRGRPVFLFHAKDDSVVSRAATFSYIGALRRTQVAFSFREVPSGDHYDSMIAAGIPAGIAWIKKQP